jgi:cyanate permease
VAAVTAGTSRRSLIGMALGAVQARARAKGRSSRLAAFVQDNVLTVAGMGAVDVGMFHLGSVQGWVAVGVSLLLIDFKLQA